MEGAAGPTVVYTDHNPLTFLPTQSTLSRRQARWVGFLARFSNTIVYKKGAENIADPISRNPELQRESEAAAQAGDPGEDDAELTGEQFLACLTHVAGSRQAIMAAAAQLAVTTRAGRAGGVLEGQWLPALPPPPAHEAPPVATAPGPKPARRRRRGRQAPGGGEPEAEAQADPAREGQEPEALWQAVARAYDSDPLFSRESRYTRGWELDEQGLWRRADRTVVVPRDQLLRERVLAEHHDLATGGHPGIARTLEQVQRTFWWPSLRSDVESYVRQCDACQMHKASTRTRAGKLRPNSIAGRRWGDLAFDLITKLPMTLGPMGFDTILVFLDRLTRMVILVPCREEGLTAEVFARLFMEHVVAHHGLPERLCSDRGTQWNNRFWAEVCRLMGMHMRMSSAYHPQFNGQVERQNRVIEEMLRHYVRPDQRDWHLQLPMVQFAMNNSWCEAIQTTPFFANHGQHPLIPAAYGISVQVPAARDFVQGIERVVSRAKRSWAEAQQRMARRVDAHRKEVTYQPGDKVALSSENERKRGAEGVKKLRPRWLGPFTVVRMVGHVAVELELPAAWRKHNVFHVGLVKPYRQAAAGEAARCVVGPPPAEWLDGEPAYAVEALTAHRWVRKGRARRKAPALEVKVKWVGYSAEHDSWEPVTSLRASAQVRAALRAYKLAKGLAATESDASAGESDG